MTLQGCPGGTGFYESVNARKTFLCALYSHEKRLPKRLHAPKGRHLEPPICGGSQWCPRGGGSRKTAPGFWKRLPSRSCEEPFFRRLWWLLWLDMLGPTAWGGSRSRQEVAAPRAVPELWLPEYDPWGRSTVPRGGSQNLTRAMLVLAVAQEVF